MTNQTNDNANSTDLTSATRLTTDKLAPYGLPARFDGIVEISHIPLDSMGYSAGRYYGVGQRVFTLTLHRGGYANETYRVRAVDRRSLRDAVKARYPHAKVAR